MQTSEAVITQFYTAFQKLDYKTMRQCYTEHPVFSDPVFGVLEGEQVFAMWEMLCKSARDFSLQFSNIKMLDEEYATCQWMAVYTFSRTGRKVTNNIKAHMRIQNGSISEHTDQFDLWKWSRQALGMPGVLLGWSAYMKNKIHNNAIKNLLSFMEKEKR